MNLIFIFFQLDHPVVGRTWIDGNYLFVIKLTPEPKGAQFNALGDYLIKLLELYNNNLKKLLAMVPDIF